MMLSNKNVYKSCLPRPFVWCMLALICATFMGCDGGLIGTSTGPAEDDGTIVVLPNKLGPRIPDTLLENDNSVHELDQRAYSRNLMARLDKNTDAAPAQSWQKLSPHFSQFEHTRIALQLELQLLESVYESVFERCGQLTSVVCEIPAGEIRATFTEDVIDNIVINNTSYDENALSSRLSAMGVEQFLDIGDEIEFGEINIQKISNAPYAYRLTISTLFLLPEEQLQLDWSTDFSNIRYSLQTVGSTVVNRYYYQRLPGAQRLTLSDTIVDADKNQGTAALEVTTGIIDNGNVQFNAHVANSKINGWATDNDAFASSLSNVDSENIILQESFQSDGNLLNSTRCEFDSAETHSAEAQCVPDEPSSVIEEPSSVAEPPVVDGVISALSGEVEFAEISITNLPENYDNFIIRRNEALHSNEVPELLCSIYTLTNLVGKQFVDVYCFTDIASALNGVVVAIDADGNEFIVDQARISDVVPLSLNSLAIGPVSNVTFNGEKITWDELPGAAGYSIYLDGYYFETVGAVLEYTPARSGTYTIIGFDELGNFSPREVINHNSVPLTNSVVVSLNQDALANPDALTDQGVLVNPDVLPDQGALANPDAIAGQDALPIGPVSNVAFNGEKITWDELPGAIGYSIYLEGSYFETVDAVREYTPVLSGAYTIIGFDEMGNFSPREVINHDSVPLTNRVIVWLGMDALAMPPVSNVTFDGKKITWDELPGAIGYSIYLDGIHWENVGAVLEFTPRRSGEYTVIGFDEMGNFNPFEVINDGVVPLTNRVVVSFDETFSGPVAGVIDGLQLEAVTNISFDGELITWDPVPGAVGYNIYTDFVYYIDTVGTLTEYRPESSGTYYIAGFDDNGRLGSWFVITDDQVTLVNSVEVIIP